MQPTQRFFKDILQEPALLRRWPVVVAVYGVTWHDEPGGGPAPEPTTPGQDHPGCGTTAPPATIQTPWHAVVWPDRLLDDIALHRSLCGFRPYGQHMLDQVPTRLACPVCLWLLWMHGLATAEPGSD